MKKDWCYDSEEIITGIQVSCDVSFLGKIDKKIKTLQITAQGYYAKSIYEMPYELGKDLRVGDKLLHNWKALGGRS